MTGSLNSSATAKASVRRVKNGAAERITDTVAVEEPLSIFLTYWAKDKRMTDSLAVTMRTPGHDAELAVGYLLGEGVVRKREDVVDVQVLGSGEGTEVRVELAPGVDVDAWRMARTNLVSSACGICGKRLFDSFQHFAALADSEWSIDSGLITTLPALLATHQQAFEQTGGVHAAALVDESGSVEASFEDVGRHNALDKLLGRALLEEACPLSRKILFLSSRGSYELVQKAAAAGASVLATVGGPSSLAVEAARHWNITLIGFVRDLRFNIYSGDWRVKLN